MPSYGMLAEFASAEQLIDAARRTRAAGYRRIEAYAPFPVQGLVEALGPQRRDPIPFITLIGGLLGGAGGYFMQWYSAVISLPINVGGRPAHSWPSFIPVTFELAVLGAALFAVVGMLLLNGLPKWYHPLFNSEAFELASRNRFYLCVRCADRKYETKQVEEHLESLDPLLVQEVPE